MQKAAFRVRSAFPRLCLCLIALPTWAVAGEITPQRFLSAYLQPLLKGREKFFSVRTETASAGFKLHLASSDSGTPAGIYTIYLSRKVKVASAAAPTIKTRWVRQRDQRVLQNFAELTLPLNGEVDPTDDLRRLLRADPYLSPMLTPPGLPVRLAAEQLGGLAKLRKIHAAAKAKGEVTRAIITWPTGLGKTVLLAAFLAERLKESPRAQILFVVQNREILQEASQRLQRLLGLATNQINRVYGEAAKEPLFKPGVVATFTTRTTLFNKSDELAARLAKPEPLLTAIDEVHHAGKLRGQFDGILNLIERANRPQDVLLGTTATPWHLDSDLIDHRFHHHVVAAFLSDAAVEEYLAQKNYIFMARAMLFAAMSKGYLSPIQRYRQIRYVGKDQKLLTRSFLNASEIELEHLPEAERIPKLTRNIRVHEALARRMVEEIVNVRQADNYRRLLKPTRGIVFVPSIAHAEVYAHLINEISTGRNARVDARPFHSGMDPDARDAAMMWYTDEDAADLTRDKYLIAINTLAEGADMPETNHIILARPYSAEDSVGMLALLQNIGRAARIARFKRDFSISDFTGDMRRLLFEGMDQALVPPLFVDGGEIDFDPRPDLVPRVTIDRKVPKLEELRSELVDVPLDLNREAAPKFTRPETDYWGYRPVYALHERAQPGSAGRFFAELRDHVENVKAFETIVRAVDPRVDNLSFDQLLAMPVSGPQAESWSERLKDVRSRAKKSATFGSWLAADHPNLNHPFGLIKISDHGWTYWRSISEILVGNGEQANVLLRFGSHDFGWKMLRQLGDAQLCVLDYLYDPQRVRRRVPLIEALDSWAASLNWSPGRLARSGFSAMVDEVYRDKTLRPQNAGPNARLRRLRLRLEQVVPAFAKRTQLYGGRLYELPDVFAKLPPSPPPAIDRVGEDRTSPTLSGPWRFPSFERQDAVSLSQLIVGEQRTLGDNPFLHFSLQNFQHNRGDSFLRALLGSALGEYNRSRVAEALRTFNRDPRDLREIPFSAQAAELRRHLAELDPIFDVQVDPKSAADVRRVLLEVNPSPPRFSWTQTLDWKTFLDAPFSLALFLCESGRWDYAESIGSASIKRYLRSSTSALVEAKQLNEFIVRRIDDSLALAGLKRESAAQRALFESTADSGYAAREFLSVATSTEIAREFSIANLESETELLAQIVASPNRSLLKALQALTTSQELNEPDAPPTDLKWLEYLEEPVPWSEVINSTEWTERLITMRPDKTKLRRPVLVTRTSLGMIADAKFDATHFTDADAHRLRENAEYYRAEARAGDPGPSPFARIQLLGLRDVFLLLRRDRDWPLANLQVFRKHQGTDAATLLVALGKVRGADFPELVRAINLELGLNIPERYDPVVLKNLRDAFARHPLPSAEAAAGRMALDALPQARMKELLWSPLTLARLADHFGLPIEAALAEVGGERVLAKYLLLPEAQWVPELERIFERMAFNPRSYPHVMDKIAEIEAHRQRKRQFPLAHAMDRTVRTYDPKSWAEEFTGCEGLLRIVKSLKEP